MTPTVTDNGEVIVQLHPVVNSLEGMVNGVPQISTRDTQTAVALHDDQTLVIGGLIQEQATKETSSIPILGLLPLVGRLFRNDSTNETRNELVIVVTPHIVKNGEAAPARAELPEMPVLPTTPPKENLPTSLPLAVLVVVLNVVAGIGRAQAIAGASIERVRSLAFLFAEPKFFARKVASNLKRKRRHAVLRRLNVGAIFLASLLIFLSIATAYYFAGRTFAQASLAKWQRVSWELSDAPNASNGPWEVYYWLKRNRGDIYAQARDRHVTPVAIAGVIAYESLIDVQPAFIKPFARYSGPGKVHFKDGRVFEGDPAAKAVENLGYLPRQSVDGRRRLLSTDSGAISYIAAIIFEYSRIAKSHGFSVSCNPGLLATFYSAWTFPRLNHYLERKQGALRANAVGDWVHSESSYLKNALGLHEQQTCD